MVTPLGDITFCGFVDNQADAWILVQACVLKRLPFCTCTVNGRGSLGIASGSIYVQDANMLAQQPSRDEEGWQYVEYDGVFTFKRALKSNGQWKKETSILVGGTCYWIECFYLPWETLDGTLQPPSLYLEYRDIAGQSVTAVPDSWKPMRVFSAGLKAVGTPLQFEFRSNVVLLLARWTKRIPPLQFQLPFIFSNSAYWITLQDRHIFRDKLPAQLASQTANLLTGLLLSSSDHYDVRNLQLDNSFTPLQNVHLYIAVFGSGDASDPAPIGAIVPFDIRRIERAFSMCLPIERRPSTTDIQAREYRLQTLLPIGCGLQPTVEQYSDLGFEHAYMMRQNTGILDFWSSVSVSDQEQIILGIEQVCQIFPRLRGSEYRSVLLVHQTHCSTAKNGLTVMEEWLEREDSTTIKLKLLDLFYESRKCEDLALVISAMLIIWNDRATSENSAVTSRVEGLVSCFTAPGPPDIQIFFHQLATSFRLALDVSDNHPNHVSIVSWLLDVEVEDQHHEVPEDLNEYCLGRLIGWTHAKALESTP